MKTRCPNCHTAFRITPEQLKARVGKVRCGQCQTVFNALDSLLDGAETPAAAAAPAAQAAPAAPENPALAATPAAAAAAPAVVFVSPYVASVREAANEALADEASEDQETSADQHASAEPLEPSDEMPPAPAPEEDEPAALSESEAQELGKATGLIMPRETTAIPGYSKWVEGMVSTSSLALPAEKASRWPFVVAATLLVVALAGQVVFHFRSEISVAVPSAKPLLAAASQALGAELPLPRRVELVSIETSDLQSDPARGKLLVLNATLRNRASYAQAYPALELSLTDTQDAALARRVFAPADYLPPPLGAGAAFAANSEIAVKLWIEAQEIAASGYRLYVFYP